MRGCVCVVVCECEGVLYSAERRRGTSRQKLLRAQTKIFPVKRMSRSTQDEESAMFVNVREFITTTPSSNDMT